MDATAVAERLRIKKTYSFGKNRHAPDAEVTTFFDSKRCLVVRYDPVGTYQPVSEMVEDYNTAHGKAKLHTMLMTAKYG